MSAPPLSVLAAPPQQQVDYILESLPLLADFKTFSPRAVVEPIGALLRRQLPFTPEQILKLVELGADPSFYFPFASVVRLAESTPMTPALADALRRMRGARVLAGGMVTGHGKIKARIDALLQPKDAARPFEAAGAWSRQIAAEITPAWRSVLEAGSEITGREPSKKWREAAAARVVEIGRESFRKTALGWLRLGPSPGNPQVQTAAREADYQRGLIWSLGEFADAGTTAAVARFAEQCLRKIPSIGAVSQRSGNACIGLLAAMRGAEAVAQLAGLATRVKYHTAQRLVQEALEEAARRQGLSREELEEITVPAIDPSGLKRPSKETAALLKAHRVRIERLLLTERAIPLDTWRAAYIDHPLIGGIARRLIWQFSSGATGIWHDGKVVDWGGAEVAPEGPVRLWHPIRSDVQTVLGWRCWLEDREVQQPFKQAHREVYLVTDAERASSPASLRFASHILRQHQFAALCAERGWKFHLMGQWDSNNTPYVEIPHAGLRAEFEVEFPRDEAVSGHTIYIYLETRAVRFLKGGVPWPLESVPPAIFSEVMRDVDLFVCVTSIGADPEWNSRPQAPFLDYWRNVSFGALSTAGAQRREVLSRLLAKLSIRDRCELEDRHLCVRGDLATYKIHLSSGNVMMEPGSRYLCIVRGAAAGVFLPFEGDAMLSLILSKAFLLAADSKIKDASILRQIQASGPGEA